MTETEPHTRAQFLSAMLLGLAFFLAATGAATFYVLRAVHTQPDNLPDVPHLSCPVTSYVVTISNDPPVNVCRDISTGRDFLP